MNILPVGAEFFHAERQTDRRTDGQTNRQKRKAKSVFRKFKIAPQEPCLMSVLSKYVRCDWFEAQNLTVPCADLSPSCRTPIKPTYYRCKTNPPTQHLLMQTPLFRVLLNLHDIS